MPSAFLAQAGDLPLPAQLGILIPFLLALGWIGRWLFSRLDQAEKAKDALYERIVAEVLPAMASTTAAAKELMEAAAAMRKERDAEREARIRAEERNRP